MWTSRGPSAPTRKTPALGRDSGFRGGLSYGDRELVAVAVRHGRFVACHALLDPDADQRSLWRARGRDLANGSRLVYPSDRGITVRSRDRLAGGLRCLAATATDRVLLIEIAFGLDRYARIAILKNKIEDLRVLQAFQLAGQVKGLWKSRAGSGVSRARCDEFTNGRRRPRAIVR